MPRAPRSHSGVVLRSSSAPAGKASRQRDGTDSSRRPVRYRVRAHERYNFSRTLVFFFQAEDGIRDVAVTGVQTCALPISHHRTRKRADFPEVLHTRELGKSAYEAKQMRSEERRVGKECRSRWSPYH